MREGRHLREQRRVDVLVRNEDVGRLEAGTETSLDKILTLNREQPKLVTPTPLLELAEKLEPLVVARRDQLPSRWRRLALSAGRRRLRRRRFQP